MKKAVIVGGSNGIGLSIVHQLLSRDYFVYILDIREPDMDFEENKSRVQYIFSDLNKIDSKMYLELSKDDEIDFLMITAGIGRVAHFESLSVKEIRQLMQINALAGIEIIRYFYDKLVGKQSFYAGMMVSIAGLVSSPLFATYSASKAALSKFIEGINIELEAKESSNRILDVSPGSIQGTKFNGDGYNNLDLTKDLSSKIVDKMMERESRFIPDYEKTYKDVIERYQMDPHSFGMNSYQYKIESGRVNDSENRALTIGYLSGTFDLFHVGHLNLLKKAKEYCDYLVVGVHPDASHKGKETFIPFEERKAIVASNQFVDMVVTSTPEDSEAWGLYGYHYLFVGSDYKGTERFNNYEKYFLDKDVEIVYFPYTDGTSSTQIRKTLSQRNISEGN